ncbi:MAG: DUF1631 family protein [Rhodocyclaceae bacterium]
MGSAPPGDRLSLLDRCRDILAMAVGRAVAALQSDLIAGPATPDPDEPGIALRADIAARWPEATQVFRSALGDFFDEQVRFAESSRLGQGYDPSVSSLKLLDDAELEFVIELQEVRDRLSEACEGELYKLGVRLAHLLDIPELDEERDPLGIAAAVYALRLFVEFFEGPLAVRLWLLRVMERKLTAVLPATYGAINAFLVGKDVLPKISPVIRRRDDRSQPVENRSPANGGPAASGAMNGLAQLRQMVAAQSAGMNHVGGSGGWGPGAAGGPVISEAAVAALNATLQTLTQLQSLGADFNGAGPKPAAGNDPALLRGIRSGPLAIAGLEPSTVDVVATLFDGIFQDETLPLAVKSLLGWLQIPLLKVALADPAFFGDVRHPARRVLDAIGALSACLDPLAGEDDAILRAIETAVGRIRGEFDLNVTLFERVLADLDPAAAGFGLPGQLSDREVAAVVDSYRRRVEGDAAVAGVIEPALRRAPRGAVAAFLDGPWRAVLSRVFAEHGDRHEDWRQFVAVVEDLLWSIEPKSGADSRKRLVTVLPSLLQRLNAGFALIGTPRPEREHFLDALVALHSAAMKAGSAVPDPESGAKGTENRGNGKGSGPAPADEVAVDTQRFGAVDVLFLYRKRPGSGLARIEAAPGAIIEFDLPGGYGTYRACLCRDVGSGAELRVLVFASARSAIGIVVSAALLASMLEGKTARWLGRDSLVQRAIDRGLAASPPGIRDSVPGA